jgi:hypothetical protein
VRFVYYSSRFYGDTKFFDDFPDVPLPDGVTLGDIYKSFAPPELAPAIIEFAPTEHEMTLFSPEADGDTMSPQRSVDYSSVRTPQANPTMAESASIYKVRFSNGRPPIFEGAVGRRSRAPQFQIYDLMHTKLGSEDEYDRYYRQCVVHVLGTTFTKCTAASGRDSIGGGLYAREGQVLVSNSDFTQCTAGFGGALALLDSCIVVQGATFTDCAAAYEGGAMLLTWHNMIPIWAPDAVAQLVEVTFVRCLSREVAGGISIKGSRDAVIDRCNFTGCRAGLSGGAVGCLASNVLVFRTHFVRNSCGGHGDDMQAGITGAESDRPRYAPRHYHPFSGGGALRFVGTTTADNEVFVLGTEESCFVGNTIVDNMVPLHSLDLYLGGNCMYQSFGDRFLNWEADSIEADAGVALRTYHTRFFGQVDKFLSAGHLCTTDSYADAYVSHMGTATLGTAASLTYGPTRTPRTAGESEGEDVEDVSQPDNTPWATRVPPATPIDYVKPTSYSPHTSLPLSHYTLHSPGTGTPEFVPTHYLHPTSTLSYSVEALQTHMAMVSELFASSRTLVHSRSFLSALGGPIVPSGTLVTAPIVLSAFNGTHSFAITPAFIATAEFSESSAWGEAEGLAASARAHASEPFLGTRQLKSPTRTSEAATVALLATVPDTAAATAPASATVTAATAAETPAKTLTATLVDTALPPASLLPRQTALVTRTATPSLEAGQILSDYISVTLTEVSRTLSQVSVMSEMVLTVSSYSVTEMSFTEIDVDSSFQSIQTKSRSFSMLFNVTIVLSVAGVTMVNSFSALEIPVYESKSVTFQLVVTEPHLPQEKKGISDALLIGICTGAAILIALFLGALRLFIRSNDSQLTIHSDEDNLGEVTVTQTEITNLDSMPIDADVTLGDGRQYREFSDDEDFRDDGFQEGDIYV